MTNGLKEIIKEAVSEYIDKHLSFTTEVLPLNKETRELSCKVDFHFDSSVEDLTHMILQQVCSRDLDL